MAQSLQVAKVSPRHEQILLWILANPDKKLGECAREFGYTQSHLSVIIHSDAFQARLRASHDAVHSEFTTSIRDKATGLAHRAMDKLLEQVETAPSPEATLAVAELALATIGMGPKSRAAPAPGVNINLSYNNSISPEELQRAREAAIAARVIDITQGNLPAPAADES